jgi:hypothetical protein
LPGISRADAGLGQLCTAAPAFWLFHPLFVRNVILPFLKPIHRLWPTPLVERFFDLDLWLAVRGIL